MTAISPPAMRDESRWAAATDRIKAAAPWIVLGVIGALAIGWPLIAEEQTADFAQALRAPGDGSLLGTDHSGYGLGVRTAEGLRISLVIALACAILATVLGVVVNAFPSSPGLAERTNPSAILKQTGAPLLGVYPEDFSLDVAEGVFGAMQELSLRAFAPMLGGHFDEKEFLSSLEKIFNIS